MLVAHLHRILVGLDKDAEVLFADLASPDVTHLPIKGVMVWYDETGNPTVILSPSPSSISHATD
jgi:hypothetical protein